MNIDGTAQESVAAEPHLDFFIGVLRDHPDVQSRVSVLESRRSARSRAEAARAQRNIAEWRTYLPEDCVAAMIKDGWDRSVL